MAEDQTNRELTEGQKKIVEQYAPEMKVIPPPNPTIRYPDVAVIPPGQKSVVIIPKESEVNTGEGEVEIKPPQENIVRIDAVAGEPTPVEK
jgi:hypothetical protein